MERLKIDFKIETLEDFHIGDGLGSIGLYDDGQLKDDDGIPVLRAETLKGLLKQSGREICQIYKAEFDQAFDLVYKYKQMNALDLRITAITANDNPLLLHSFTAIEHSKRRAKNTSLRTFEFGAAGLRFDITLNFTLNVDEEIAKSVKKFLELSIRNLKAIGKGRRRGNGLVHCTINKSERMSMSEIDIKLEEGVKSLCLILELAADTTISESGQTGNLMRSLDYIPGTMILGMLRAPLVQQEKWDKKYLDDDQCSVSNFYPLPKDTLPDKWPDIIPVPLSLRKKKSTDQRPPDDSDENLKKVPPWILTNGVTGRTVADLATRDTLLPENEGALQGFSDKSFGEGYILEDKADISKSTYYKVGKQTILRNQIDVKSQTTTDNSVFLQEIIPKGTRFIGRISFESQELCKAFVKDYSPWVSGTTPFLVGRGGKPAVVKKYFSLNDDASSIAGIDKGFTITCLGDVIFLDDKLRPLTTMSKEFVAAMAGIPPESIETLNMLTGSRTIQSYSGLSGIRRFSDEAIMKGSCFAFKVKNDISSENRKKLSDLLTSWQKNGLGFRRNEGFGRVAINHPIHTYTTTTKTKQETGAAWSIFCDTQERLKKRAEKNALLIANQKKLADELNKKIQSKSKRLSKSQLGNFISILESNVQLSDFFDKITDLKENTSSREQIEAFNALLLAYYKTKIDITDRDFRQELILALRSIRTEG